MPDVYASMCDLCRWVDLDQFHASPQEAVEAASGRRCPRCGAADWASLQGDQARFEQQRQIREDFR